jgi:molybdopterin biosynthesis enzyme MoaB
MVTWVRALLAASPHPSAALAIPTGESALTQQRSLGGIGVLLRRLLAAGHTLAAVAIVADDVSAIQAQVRAWAAEPGVDVLGGTSRDDQ